MPMVNKFWSFLNVVIHEHQFKRKEKFHFDEEAYMKPKKPDLYVLHRKSSYDVMLFMFQSRQQHFADFSFVWLLDTGICKNTF